MAFTCRPEERHEQILQRICKKYHINTKQRALFHVLERFEEVEADRDELMRKVRGLESELSALQQAVRRKIEADENLLRCRDAAKELTELRKKTRDFPEISIIFMNEEADLIPNFFKYAGAEYPYKIIEVIPFWKILGSGKDTPGVKYLWNGNEYKYYWGITDNKFDVVDFEKLINKPYTELKK